MDDQTAAEVPARGALRRWIEADRDRSQSSLARLLSVSQPSVSAWLAGPNRPEAHHREALEALTGIPADDWKTSHERALVQRIRALPAAEPGTDLAATGS